MKGDFNGICKGGVGSPTTPSDLGNADSKHGMTIFINHKDQIIHLDVGVNDTVRGIEKRLNKQENTGGILSLNRKVLRTGDPYLADVGVGSEIRLDYTKKLNEIDLDGADLTGADLTDIDLTELSSKIDVYALDLTGADLSKATMSGLDISKMKIAGANLRKAQLVQAQCVGVNLSGANLSEANLSEADLREAILSGADLRGAIVRSANLSGADLSRAYLMQASLNESILDGAQLHDTQLQYARLIGVVAKNIVFKKCHCEFVNFEGARFTEAIVESSDFPKAVFINIIFTETEIRDCDFSKTFFKDAKILYGKIEFCNFTDAKFVTVQFFHLPLRYLNFNKASLNGVNFQDNDRGSGDNYKLKMYNVSFKDAKLKNVEFGGQIFYVDFTEAIIDRATVKVLDYSHIAFVDSEKLTEIDVKDTVDVDHALPYFFSRYYPNGIDLTREQANARREAVAQHKKDEEWCTIM